MVAVRVGRARVMISLDCSASTSRSSAAAAVPTRAAAARSLTGDECPGHATSGGAERPNRHGRRYWFPLEDGSRSRRVCAWARDLVEAVMHLCGSPSWQCEDRAQGRDSDPLQHGA
jgi:hypothetical protein